MAYFAELSSLTRDYLWTSFIVFIRVGALISLAPAFGAQALPVRVKLGVALAFTSIVTPIVGIDIPDLPTRLRDQVALCGPEILTGLFFGIVLRLFIFTLQIAGSIAAQSTSLAQIFGGSAGADPQPAIGHLLVSGGMAIAAIMGLHVQMVAYIFHGYDMVPPGVLIDADEVLTLGLAEVARTMTLAFRLAGPFLIASLVYNVTLGIINRAMPQLMVSFVGAPAITAGGLFLMMITAPIMLGIWVVALQDFMAMPFGPPL